MALAKFGSPVATTSIVEPPSSVNAPVPMLSSAETESVAPLSTSVPPD
jgi:hypothetical protein